VPRLVGGLTWLEVPDTPGSRARRLNEVLGGLSGLVGCEWERRQGNVEIVGLGRITSDSDATFVKRVGPRESGESGSDDRGPPRLTDAQRRLRERPHLSSRFDLSTARKGRRPSIIRAGLG
jgi:hypothetical protein